MESSSVLSSPFLAAKALCELGKPRLTMLAVCSTAAGLWMGDAAMTPMSIAWPTLLGATLVGLGANALNQWWERALDARMSRTRHRPLPSGRVAPAQALWCGVVTSLLGVAILWWGVNPLAGWLGSVTVISYIGLYTPMKRWTSLCTLMGAIPGALPPMIGWVAARGVLTLEGWILGAILFLWQLPHFLGIAWVHRDDYARAGFQMLPVIEPDGVSVGRHMVLYSLALLLTSLLPTVIGLTGWIYALGALGIGLWFLLMAMRAARQRSREAASRLFSASVIYLPLLWMLMVVDKAP